MVPTTGQTIRKVFFGGGGGGGVFLIRTNFFGYQIPCMNCNELVGRSMNIFEG